MLWKKSDPSYTDRPSNIVFFVSLRPSISPMALCFSRFIFSRTQLSLISHLAIFLSTPISWKVCQGSSSWKVTPHGSAEPPPLRAKMIFLPTFCGGRREPPKFKTEILGKEKKDFKEAMKRLCRFILSGPPGSQARTVRSWASKNLKVIVQFGKVTFWIFDGSPHSAALPSLQSTFAIKVSHFPDWDRLKRKSGANAREGWQSAATSGSFPGSSCGPPGLSRRGRR